VQATDEEIEIFTIIVVGMVSYIIVEDGKMWAVVFSSDMRWETWVLV
jgi:hypothetical protein